MAGINIPFLSDVRDFLRGGDSVADKLDDVADSLDDVADAGKDTGDAFDDTAREAGDAADKIEKDFTDALDKVRDAGKAAGKAVGDDVGDGARQAGDGLDTLKEEADGTAREVAAGFDGTSESIAEGFQEVAANALAGFGPAGAAAGLAAAAGLGIALAKLTEVSEAVNEAREAGAEWATTFNQESLNGRITALRDSWAELTAEVRDSREWYEVWQDDAVTAIEQIADASGIAADDVGRFMDSFNETDPVRRLEDLEDVLESVRAKQQELSTANLDAANQWDVAEARALGEKRDQLGALGDIIEEQADKQRAANEVEAAHAEALGLTVEGYRDRRRALDRATEAQDAFAESLVEIADPVSVYEDALSSKEDAEQRTAEATAAATKSSTDSWEDYAEDVKVTTEDLIDTWNRQAKQARAFESNLATIAAAGGQALADELRAKGPEVAGSVAEVIAEAGPRKRREAIEAHSRATGESISSGMASGVKAGRGDVEDAVEGVVGSITPTPIPIGVATADASAAVAAWRALQQSIPVTLGLRVP